MYIQQEHLPKEEPARGDEQWPFNLVEFIEGNWIYLTLIVVILLIFLYARYDWRKKHPRR